MPYERPRRYCEEVERTPDSIPGNVGRFIGAHIFGGGNSRDFAPDSLPGMYTET